VEELHSQGGEALERVAKRGCGCLISGGIQKHIGQGPGQPDPVGGIPVGGRGVGTR